MNPWQRGALWRRAEAFGGGEARVSRCLRASPGEEVVELRGIRAVLPIEDERRLASRPAERSRSAMLRLSPCAPRIPSPGTLVETFTGSLRDLRLCGWEFVVEVRYE